MIENHETARIVVKTAMDANRLLDDSVRIVLKNGSPEEVRKYKLAVGTVMNEIAEQTLNPLLRRHGLGSAKLAGVV
jgi:hypothetical protein